VTAEHRLYGRGDLCRSVQRNPTMPPRPDLQSRRWAMLRYFGGGANVNTTGAPSQRDPSARPRRPSTRAEASDGGVSHHQQRRGPHGVVLMCDAQAKGADPSADPFWLCTPPGTLPQALRAARSEQGHPHGPITCAMHANRADRRPTRFPYTPRDSPPSSSRCALRAGGTPTAQSPVRCTQIGPTEGRPDFRTPPGTRTLNPLIKSQLLCQLS
jgi:hypothetical protein